MTENFQNIIKSVNLHIHESQHNQKQETWVKLQKIIQYLNCSKSIIKKYLKPDFWIVHVEGSFKKRFLWSRAHDMQAFILGYT